MPITYHVDAAAARVSAYPMGSKVPRVFLTLPRDCLDREPYVLAAIIAAEHASTRANGDQVTGRRS